MEGAPEKKPFEPWLDLKRALDERGIDYKSPDFTEEAMLAKFKAITEDESESKYEKLRFQDLLAVLTAHKFWE